MDATDKKILKAVQEIAGKSGINEFRILVTLREYKKSVPDILALLKERSEECQLAKKR
ncbi:hypothetical protein IBX65_07675 [Candidatus Aerophobetes bacterium]|nr:hypothetical protein [Candidatus Aerophobetes bacterium]